MHSLLKSRGVKPRKGKIFKCITCDKEFYKQPSFKIKKPACSYKCYGIAQRKRTELICHFCNKIFYRANSTVKWFKIRKRKNFYCSKKCLLQQNQGENHYKWIKDRTLLKVRPNNNADHKKWREEIFRRDNYTCQECGIRGGKLEAHHIKRWADYPALRFELENGKSLCVKCHNKTKGRPKK